MIALDTNDMYEELLKDCLDDRVLILNNEITDSVIEDYCLYIMRWNMIDAASSIPKEARRKIFIVINSVGGSTFDADGLMDVITTSNTPVVGIGIGLVASAAYNIYLACHDRLAFSRTSFLHAASGSSVVTVLLTTSVTAVSTTCSLQVRM